MPLSGQWTFTVTRDDIIKEAMLNVGALGEGEAPTAQEVTDCARKLNMMVKQWMGTQDFAPGLKMWERQRGELFLTSTQGAYDLGPGSRHEWAGSVAAHAPGPYGGARRTYDQAALVADAPQGANLVTVDVANNITVGDRIGIFIGPDLFWTNVTSVALDSGNIGISSQLPAAAASGNVVYNYTTKAQRPLAILTCTLRDQFGTDSPLGSMTLQEYEALPTKLQPDFLTDPTAFYYESQFESGTDNTGPGILFLDMYGAQDTNKHLHIVYIRPVMDFVNPTDTPEYPQQWYRALCWGLSREISPMFDAEWTPEMQANHDQSLMMAREADAETTSMYFQPNDWNDYGV